MANLSSTLAEMGIHLTDEEMRESLKNITPDGEWQRTGLRMPLGECQENHQLGGKWAETQQLVRLAVKIGEATRWGSQRVVMDSIQS